MIDRAPYAEKTRCAVHVRCGCRAGYAGLVLVGAVIGFIVAALLIRPYRTDRFEMAVTDNFSGSFEGIPELDSLSAEILALTGLHSNIRVYLDTRNPGLCGYSTPVLRTIVLSEECSKPLRKADGSYNWKIVGTLAHEIGHVLSGHGDAARDKTDPGTPTGEQLEAEEFAGWAMRKLGATHDDAMSYASWRDVQSEDYRSAVERGWHAAN